MPNNIYGPRDCVDAVFAFDDDGKCRCCEADGHHWDRTGNDPVRELHKLLSTNKQLPEALEYPCRPCNGTGEIVCRAQVILRYLRSFKTGEIDG